MNAITLWYARLSRKARVVLVSCIIGLALIITFAVAYMAMVPEKVQVRTGTIVRDPIDGYVWEDDTQTLMVNPSDVANYHVVYVDKLSDEHTKQLQDEQQQRAEERAKLANTKGVEAMQTVVPGQTMADLQTMQGNMETMSAEVITGLQMANEIDETRKALTQFRNQLAATPVPAELESLKQQGIRLVDMGIQACTLTLQFIGTGDQAILQQAQDLATKAANQWQQLIAPFIQSG
jgi:hypothetical protein